MKTEGQKNCPRHTHKKKNSSEKNTVLYNRRRNTQLTRAGCLPTHRSASNKRKAAGTLFNQPAFPEGQALFAAGKNP